MTNPLATLRDSSIVINDEYKPCDSDIDCLSLIFNEAVFLIVAMTSKVKVVFLIFVLLNYISNSCGQNHEISDAIKRIFLMKHFNSTDSELIFKLARESYLFLKDAEKKSSNDKKLNFAKNYANFLLKFFKELQTKDIDIFELFSKQNLFLKDYDSSQTLDYTNITELKSKIEDLEFVVEQHLIAYCNSSNASFEVSEVLALNETSFEDFLKEKLRADYSEIGYFFLEVFATLIALSWGLISTIIYYTESATENISHISVF